MPNEIFSLRASQSHVSVGSDTFDAATGEGASNITGFLLGLDKWTYTTYISRSNGDPNALTLSDGFNHSFDYVPPAVFDFDPWNALVRYSPAAHRVEVVSQTRYYCWQSATRHLERAFQFDSSPVASLALTRDSSSVVTMPLNQDGFNWISTQSGRLVRHVGLIPSAGRVKMFSYGKFDLGDWDTGKRLSPFGSYALLLKTAAPPASYRAFWCVADARTGRELWSFQRQAPHDVALFSPDETRLAIPQFDQHKWQICDIATGKLLLTLPLVPDTMSAIFSPDGATLYSVANGILYRQRAR